jgi:hypothetical protein
MIIMKLRYFNLVCFTIINLHFEYVSSINRAYDYFRILFDNQEILKPHDIDLITNQLMTNVSFFFFTFFCLFY